MSPLSVEKSAVEIENCVIFSKLRRCRLEGELENATYDNPDINLRHALR
jgi:hypothetical protein